MCKVAASRRLIAVVRAFIADTAASFQSTDIPATEKQASSRALSARRRYVSRLLARYLWTRPSPN